MCPSCEQLTGLVRAELAEAEQEVEELQTQVQALDAAQQEVALLALDRAPGLVRSRFAFETTVGFDADRWKTMRNNARKRARKTLDAPIVASDIDAEAVEAARANAETAGVAHLIDFHVADFAAAQLWFRRQL